MIEQRGINEANGGPRQAGESMGIVKGQVRLERTREREWQFRWMIVQGRKVVQESWCQKGKG